MINTIPFKNVRSVTFNCVSFVSQVKRGSRLRHAIYGSRNAGVDATPTGLSTGTRMSSIKFDQQENGITAFGRRFNFTEAEIHFSEALNPTSFIGETSGQLIVNPLLGKILNLHQRDKNTLLVVQEHGFATLEVTHDPSAFTLATLAQSFQPVVKNTAQVFGDEVYYLTRGGMCRILRSGRVELLDTPVGYDEGHNYLSAVYESRYYLSLPNKILVIERFFEGFSFIGDEKIWWESEPFGLSYGAGRQWLKQFLIKTNAHLTVTLTATSTGRTQVLEIEPSDELQRIQTNLRGDMFRIKVETDAADVGVSNLSCVVAFGN